jgi:hypothetical protein
MKKAIIVLAAILAVIPVVLATIDISPMNPTIGGNGWIFMTFNDSSRANQVINITLYDNNSVLKESCLKTLNARGFTSSPCKYTFVKEDTAGQWTIMINDTIENRSRNVSKIQVTLLDRYSLSEIAYGSRTKFQANISYQGTLPKEIVKEVMGRDLGGMQINTFEDTDGDGRSEIVVPETNGRIFIWQNLSRMFDGLPNVTGKDFQSADFGGLYAQSRCRFGDFNGDGKKTMICADTSGILRAWTNINISAGANVNYVNSSDDVGTYRGDPEVCDVTNDGIYDQVCIETYDGPIFVYNFTEGVGFIKLYNTTDLGANAQDSNCICGDFDGDGYNEWTVWEGASGVRLLDVNLSTPIFNLSLGTVATDRGAYLQGAQVDYDRDGKMETVFALSTGYLQTLKYNRSGTNLYEENMTWQGEGTDITDFVSGSADIAFDDLNHNGYDDFAILGSVNHPPLLFYEYNISNTSRWDRTVIDYIAEQSTSSVSYVDFDGDGFKEIMAFGRYTGNTYVFRYNGVTWDIIYRGWLFGHEEVWTGDGLKDAATPINGWHYVRCATGDMDYDGREEALCTPYDGNQILYQEADVAEYNVTPYLTATQTITDGSYEDLNGACPEMRLKSSGTNLCIKLTNVALKYNNSLDEDGQNQGNISSRWTDGVFSSATYYASQVAADTATLDTSTTEDAVFSVIKFDTNYTVGKINVWNYHVDGRSFNNVIVQSTTNNSGAICNWTTNTTLFDNSADGSNRKYCESHTGKTIYIEPTMMSCFRESTSGSNYGATVNNNTNFRSELELYSVLPYLYFSAGVEREDESALNIGDNWTINLTLQDRTGFIINISDSHSIPIVNVTPQASSSYNAIIISNDALSHLVIS